MEPSSHIVLSDEALEAYTNLERQTLINQATVERDYTREEIANIEIRQLQCHIETVRALLVNRPVFPGGTHLCTSIQLTIGRLQEKMIKLLDDRNSSFPDSQPIYMEDVRNRGSWLWDKELQDLEETGINDAIRKQIDAYQRKLRSSEEEMLISQEISNLKGNINELIGKIESSPVNPGLQERSKIALGRYKADKIDFFRKWIIDL